jgi:membrane-bound serine protease (ClpP class)
MLNARLGATAAQRAGIVRFVSPSLADFVKSLDGLTVTTGAGPVTLSIKTSEVTVVFHKPGPVRRFLHVLTSATLVYLLIVVGAGLVVFEFFQPGFGVAGVTGALMLAAAGYGLSVLPFAWWALVLVFAGLALMTLDVAIHGLGAPTAVGLAALVVGSVWLVRAAPLRVPIWMVVVAAVAALIYFVPVLTTVKRNRRPVARGASRALLGQYGEVRSILNPEGFVWVSGGLWRARSEDGSRMRVGEPVEVTGLAGDVLTVRRSV